MPILRTGGAVQIALLDILETYAPGVRGLKHGGVSIGKHLDDWGDKFLNAHYIEQPLSAIAKKFGQTGIENNLRQIKKAGEKYDFVNLTAAMYRLQQKNGFTNASDKKLGPTVKAMGEYMIVSSILQFAMPLIRIAVQTRSIKPTSAFVIGNDIASALEKIVGSSEIKKAFEIIYSDYDATTFPTGGEIRDEYLSLLEPIIPGVRGVFYGGAAIGGHLDEWGEKFIKTGLIDKPISEIAKSGEAALIKFLKDLKARRGKGKDEEKPELINAIAAGYYLQKKHTIGIGRSPQVTAANQLALALLLMNVVYPTLDTITSLRVIKGGLIPIGIKKIRIEQVLDATINDIFGVDIAGPIRKVLG